MADKRETETKSEEEEVQVKLTFRIPPRMPSVYAHHMFIQHGQNEVILSFFEVMPPILTEEQVEERRKIVQETGIVAECVARITVAKASFSNFAKAMQQVAEQINTPEPQESQNADN